MPHLSPHVLDKSALYSGSRLFVLRAWQPAAAMPAAQNPLRTTVECRFIVEAIYRARVVRSPEELPSWHRLLRHMPLRDNGGGVDSIVDQASITEDDLALAVARYIGLMCNEYDGDTSCVEPLQDAHDLYTRLAVQVACWFVGQDDRWSSNQRTGNSHALLLSTREFHWPVICS